MQVSVESPTTLERRVTIVVPTEKIDQAFESRISKLGKTAKVNGYRTGKVPLNVIRQRYGDSARQEALSEVIQSSLYAAIQQEKLQPVDVPTVEPKNIVAGQPLEFVARFEVMPALNDVNFSVPHLEKRVATIAEKDVEQVLQRLREQHVKWRAVDRIAQEKDQVIIDFSGAVEGKLFDNGQATDYPIILGSKMMIPGFEEGLMGMKAGEEKVVPVIFPANYFAKEVAGKTADFTMKVHKVLAPEYPEQNESFIKKVGIKSGKIEDLRTEVKINLERELARVIRAKFKTEVFQKLMEQNTVDIPRSLIEREAKRVHDQVHPHRPGEHHDHTAEEMAGFTEVAKRNVAIGLLVAALVKKYQITLDKDRVQDLISSLASAYDKPEDVFVWYKQDKRRMAEVEMQVLEEQVLEKILEDIRVNEKVVSYTELMQQPV